MQRNITLKRITANITTLIAFKNKPLFRGINLYIMKHYVSPLETSGLDDIIKYLNEIDISTEYVNKDKYGFSRTIKFKVYDTIYRISWFKNQSELLIGENKRCSRIPFKYIYFDNTYPCIGGNKCIGFSQVKFEKKNMFDKEFPYECFRIPIEL